MTAAVSSLQGPIFPGQVSYEEGEMVGDPRMIGTVTAGTYDLAVWASLMYQHDPLDPMEGWVSLASHPHPRLHTILMVQEAGWVPTPVLQFDGVSLNDLLVLTTPDILFSPVLDADLSSSHPCSLASRVMKCGPHRTLRLHAGEDDALVDVWAICVAADPITDDLSNHAIWFDMGLVPTH